MKKPIKTFTSYACDNQRLADDLFSRLERLLSISRGYAYDNWRNLRILGGETWDQEIRSAMGECDLGILFLCPDFFASEYIRDVEVPALLSGSIPVVPVLLERVNFDLAEGWNLNALQYCAWTTPSGAQKAYADCNGSERTKFANRLFEQIEQRLNKVHS